MALDAGAGPLQRREPGSADRVEVADREVDVEPERKRGVGATICRNDERPVEVGKRPPRSGGNDDDPFDHSQLPPLALPRSGSRVGGAHVRPLSPVAPSSPYGSANRSAPPTKLVFIAHELSPRFASALRLLRCHVRGRQPTVDEERRAVHVRRLVAREEEGRVDDLARLRQPSHREVDPPALVGRRVVAEDPE